MNFKKKKKVATRHQRATSNHLFDCTMRRKKNCIVERYDHSRSIFVERIDTSPVRPFERSRTLSPGAWSRSSLCNARSLQHCIVCCNRSRCFFHRRLTLKRGCLLVVRIRFKFRCSFSTIIRTT